MLGPRGRTLLEQECSFERSPRKLVAVGMVPQECFERSPRKLVAIGMVAPMEPPRPHTRRTAPASWLVGALVATISICVVVGMAAGPPQPKLTVASDIHPKSPTELAAIKQHLSRSPFFSALGNDELTQVIVAMRPRLVRAGERVIRIGDVGESMFVVASGSLNCSVPVNGTETIVKTCRVGDVFGEWALLYSQPRAASVVCWHEARVWELHKSVFWMVASKNPRQWELIARDISQHRDGGGYAAEGVVREAMHFYDGR